MIDGRQIRAARALLGWNRADLASHAGISVSAVLRLEAGVSDARLSTVQKVRDSLTAHGVQFLGEDARSIGVMLHI
jgi:predicted transcriptional regulator